MQSYLDENDRSSILKEQGFDSRQEDVPPALDCRQVVLVAAPQHHVRMLSVEPEREAAAFSLGADVGTWT